MRLTMAPDRFELLPAAPVRAPRLVARHALGKLGVRWVGTAGKTLGPIDTAPYYAVPVSIGAMGTKGGPRTDRDGRVLDVGARRLRGCMRQAMP